MLDIETAEETHEALKLRVEALERKISELNQAEKTLRRQNNYLTALHETSLGLIDHLDKEIAEILCISKNTVLFHRYNIRQKLDLKNKKINLRSHLLSFDR